MISALMTSIQTVLEVLTEIEFYYDEAPDGQAGQYCVWFLMPTVFTYDTGKQYTTAYPQFDFYADSSNIDDLTNLLNAIIVFESAFTKNTIIVSGYDTMKLREISRTEPRKEGHRWRIIIEYELMFCQN